MATPESSIYLFQIMLIPTKQEIFLKETGVRQKRAIKQKLQYDNTPMQYTAHLMAVKIIVFS